MSLTSQSMCDGGRPPSWIYYARVRTTREGHLVVFIAVQNLVGNWNRCSSFDNMHVFSILAVWLGNAYSRRQNWGFGGI